MLDKHRSHSHTRARAQLSRPGTSKRGGGTKRRQMGTFWRFFFLFSSYQNGCESFLQLAGLGHGELQRHVVSSEVSVLVHAPRVPHVVLVHQQAPTFLLLSVSSYLLLPPSLALSLSLSLPAEKNFRTTKEKV